MCLKHRYIKNLDNNNNLVIINEAGRHLLNPILFYIISYLK